MRIFFLHTNRFVGLKRLKSFLTPLNFTKVHLGLPQLIPPFQNHWRSDWNRCLDSKLYLRFNLTSQTVAIMKRSHSSDEEDAQPITDSKKSKNEPVFSNDNYYVIRKSKPTSVSLASLDSLMSKDKFKEADRRSTSSLTDKRDRFAPFDKKDRIHEKKDRSSFERPFDRSSSFGKSSFADSFKSQSTSSLIQPERSNISQGGYNIKIPTKFKLDIASQFGSDKQASKTSSSGYEIRSTSKNGKLKMNLICLFKCLRSSRLFQPNKKFLFFESSSIK